MSQKISQGYQKGHYVDRKGRDHSRRNKYIIRPRYGKSKFKHWAGNDSLEWLFDSELEAVFFLDQCMQRVSRTTIAENLSRHIKVLPFPKPLEHAHDDVVLRTVMDFLLNNKILISDKIKIYFFTRDEQFALGSNAEQVFKEYGFRINFLIMRWTLICIREIREELERSLQSQH